MACVRAPGLGGVSGHVAGGRDPVAGAALLRHTRRGLPVNKLWWAVGRVCTSELPRADAGKIPLSYHALWSRLSVRLGLRETAAALAVRPASVGL